MNLETKRLLIKPLLITDLINLKDNLKISDSNININHLEINDLVKGSIGKKIEKMNSVKSSLHDWYTYWLIINKENNIGMGLIGFKGLNDDGVVEIGYGISKEFERKGYMTEALGELIEWAFCQGICEKIKAIVLVKTNIGSQKVLEKNRFIKVCEDDSKIKYELLNDKTTISDKIRDKNVNIEYFVDLIVINEYARKVIVNQMLTNKDIMVYYHCFYVVSKTSEIKPQLFYQYWDEFVKLLHHKNSYHRDIGLTILANLISVDTNHYFDVIIDDYLKILNDEKFMTSQCLVRNLSKIVKIRTDLISKITNLLLDVDKETSYPLKQKELLKYDILEIIELIFHKYVDVERLKSFIRQSLYSISPKTNKKAKALVIKYDINTLTD